MATASLTHTYIAGTLAKASEVNTNFSNLLGFLNTEVIQRDASVAFTAIPSGPATDPTADNQFARKAYVDKLGVLAQDRRTSNSVNANPNVNFDMSVQPLLVAGRWYAVHFHSRINCVSSGDYTFELYRAGAKVAELQNTFDVIAGADDMIDGQYIFQEGVGGTFTYNFRPSAGSSGAVTLLASAANPRTFTVWDIGA